MFTLTDWNKTVKVSLQSFFTFFGPLKSFGLLLSIMNNDYEAMIQIFISNEHYHFSQPESKDLIT